ncbi:MAG: hypothetical protein JO270_06090 [Acidobacteriaceae bacterium]|nr:hypothetical protein [Acidobacteriaceae bacterium]
MRVFVFSFLAYLVTWGGHYTTGDGAHKIAWAKAMLSGHPALSQVNPDIPYSKYGVGHSVIAMAPLAASFLVHRYTGIRCEAALYTLLFVANGALLVSLIAFYLAHFYDGRRAILTAGLIGFATIWWPYTKLDFSEAFVTTIFFCGFVLMRFGAPVLGMGVAAAVLTIRTDAAILIVLLAIWFLVQQPRIRVFVKLGLAVVPSIAVVAAANYARYHSFGDKGYAGESFSTPLLIGLYGILFSAGKSIFLFSPPLIAGLLGWRRFRSGSATRLDAGLFLAVFIAELLVYSMWWDWSGDDDWGVRFLIPGVVLMCIPIAGIMERKILIGTVAAAGVLIQALPVMVGPITYLLLLRAQPAYRQALYMTGRNRVDFEDIRFSPSYNQIAGSWILLRCLLHIPPDSRPTPVSETDGTSLYDSLPVNAWQDAAHWDFVWAARRE